MLFTALKRKRQNDVCAFHVAVAFTVYIGSKISAAWACSWRFRSFFGGFTDDYGVGGEWMGVLECVRVCPIDFRGRIFWRSSLFPWRRGHPLWQRLWTAPTRRSTPWSFAWSRRNRRPVGCCSWPTDCPAFDWESRKLTSQHLRCCCCCC